MKMTITPLEKKSLYNTIHTQSNSMDPKYSIIKGLFVGVKYTIA